MTQQRCRWPVAVAAFAALSVTLAAVVLLVLLRPDPGPGVIAAPPPARAAGVTTSSDLVTLSPTAIEDGLAPSKPAALEIPAIGVRASRITDLGLTSGGALEVPGDATTVGWFTGAPTPGEAGPAVLAAHVDYKHVPGTFGRLKEMRAGQQVRVRRADGKTTVFTVYRVDRYAKASFPTEQVYGDTSGPELRLITCGGAFDRSSGNYLDNVVVYARLTAVT